MAELKREERTNLDLSSESEVLTYTYSGVVTREVMARVTLGDGVQNLAGDGGIYSARVYLNGILITPTSDVSVPSGNVRTILVSRPFPVESLDTVSIRVVGLAGDTAVNTLATLRDATPPSLGDVLGAGPVRVDHDYPTTSNLLVTTQAGVGIDGATILAYRTEDWDAGLRDNLHIVARTLTTTGGRWANPMYLDPGDWSLVSYRQPDYLETVTALTVE